MTKFIYNPKTCRYEREGFNLWRTFVFMMALFAITSLLFTGIGALHAFIFKSHAEIAMRTENDALQLHYSLVSQQFSESTTQLNLLEEKDKKLKATLFNSIFSETTESPNKNETPLNINSLSKLRKSIHALADRTDNIKSDASFNSSYFMDKLSGDRKSIISNLLATPSILPIADGQLISGFGKRIHPFHKGLYNHEGLDFAATRGTEVLATADGVVSEVTLSDLLAGYGNSIELDHNTKMSTRYAHLETILVKEGQKVKKGQVIGTVGSSGGSIAPHLHYEVLKNGKEQNPIYYLLQNVHPETYQALSAIGKKQNQSLD